MNGMTEHFLRQRELFSAPPLSKLLLCCLSEEMAKPPWVVLFPSISYLRIYVRLSDSRAHNASSLPCTEETTSPSWQFSCLWESWRLDLSNKVLVLGDLANKTAGIQNRPPRDTFDAWLTQLLLMAMGPLTTLRQIHKADFVCIHQTSPSTHSKDSGCQNSWWTRHLQASPLSPK